MTSENVTHLSGQEPTNDAGIAWWNSLSKHERRIWLLHADSAAPADAWRAYQAVVSAVESIAAVRDRQADGLDVHDRAVVERSLGILRDGAPTLGLIVSAYLAAGPGARLVLREREWGGHEALIVIEGEERSRQGVDAATAEALRPLVADEGAS